MRDEATLLELAKMQLDCGADYIDLNCSALGDGEEATLTWVVSLIRENLEAKISWTAPIRRRFFASLLAVRESCW